MDVLGENEVDLSYIKAIDGDILGKANSMNKGAQKEMDKLCS